MLFPVFIPSSGHYLRAAQFETSCLAQRLKVQCDAMHESFAEVKQAFSMLDVDVGLINLRPNEPLVSSGDMRSLLRTAPPRGGWPSTACPR